jgi:hypothetical protein
MIKFVSFLGIIAFALSASPIEAAKKKTPVATASAPAQNSLTQSPTGKAISKWAPTYAACKMSGRC